MLDAAEKEDFNRVVSYNSVNAMGLFMGQSESDCLPFAEEHACQSGRLYGMSKYMGEQVFQLFTKGTGISMVRIRPPLCYRMSA